MSDQLCYAPVSFAPVTVLRQSHPLKGVVTSDATTVRHLRQSSCASRASGAQQRPRANDQATTAQ